MTRLPGHVWVDGRIVRRRRARPDRVRPRLPARRRGLRDAPGPRRPADRAGRARRPPAPLGRRPRDPAARRPRARSSPRRSTSCSRPRALAARTATPASGSRSRAARSSGAACCRPTSTRARRSSSRRGRCRRRRRRTSRSGLHLVAERASGATRRTRSSALKTTSRADYVYARVEARGGGRRRRALPDDRRLPVRGHVGQPVPRPRRRELATPSLACAILPGTTRDWILRWAASVGSARRRACSRPATSPRPTRRSCRAASPGSCR